MARDSGTGQPYDTKNRPTLLRADTEWRHLGYKSINCKLERASLDSGLSSSLQLLDFYPKRRRLCVGIQPCWRVLNEWKADMFRISAESPPTHTHHHPYLHPHPHTPFARLLLPKGDKLDSSARNFSQYSLHSNLSCKGFSTKLCNWWKCPRGLSICNFIIP